MGEGALDYAVQLFAKAPVAGRVKTRMVPVLGERGSERLHRALLGYCLDQLRAAAPRVELHYDEAHAYFDALAHQPCYRQRGADLGERLWHAAGAGLRRHAAVVLVGADCPFVDARYLRRAVAALRGGASAVVGPADDGGYVLLGLREVDESLFSDIPWGSGEVMAITRARLDALGWQWRELGSLPDIDRPEDLPKMAELPGLAAWQDSPDPGGTAD